MKLLSTYFDLLMARLMWIYVLFKRGMFYHTPQIRNTSKHGCTYSGHLVVLSTKCCSLAPSIFQSKYCIYIYLIYHIVSVNTTYKFLNLLLHVSTYISHRSGVPMNPDYLQSAARRKSEKTDIHDGRKQDYKKTTTPNSSAHTHTHTHTHTHAHTQNTQE